MRKNINIFIPVAMAILLGSLTFIFAQTADDKPSRARPEFKNDFGAPPPPLGEFGRGPGGPGGFGRHILDQLGLTAAQKEQVETFETAGREASKEYFGKVRAADEQLRMMMDGGNYSGAQARPLVKEKAQAMAEIELIRLGTEAAISKLLTTEQKAQLAQLKDKRPPFPPGSGPRPGQ